MGRDSEKTQVSKAVPGIMQSESSVSAPKTKKNTKSDGQSILCCLPVNEQKAAHPTSPPSQDGSELTDLRLLDRRGMKRFNAVFKRGLSRPPKRLKRQIAYHPQGEPKRRI